MIKDKISAVVNNLKLSISSLKICLDAMEEFYLSTIDNEYVRNASIFQFLLKISTSSIGVISYFFTEE